jgi:hypothetical protein
MVYSLKKISELIKVDGFPDDKGWQEIQPTSRFYAVLPMDTGFAKVYTEVKMCFDDKNLYLLAINYEKSEGPYMVESLMIKLMDLPLDPMRWVPNGMDFYTMAEKQI